MSKPRMARLSPQGVVFTMACAGLCGLGALRAQTSDRPARFEVTSVKQNDAPGGGGSLGFRPGGDLRAVHLRPVDLLRSAYRTTPQLLDSQIIGVPDWATAQRYDITARISTEAPQDATAAYARIDEYLKSLLQDRFALQAHMEKREQPVYALVASSRVKLKPASIDCTKPENRSKCGIKFGDGSVTGPNLTVANLAATIANAVGRPVIDRTNIAGMFDVSFQWAAGPGDPSDDRPSIFAAVEEQLGLKLESARAPVDVLIVDHLERPAQD